VEAIAGSWKKHGMNKHSGRLTWHQSIRWMVAWKVRDQAGGYGVRG
jgi:hypothetical protein